MFRYIPYLSWIRDKGALIFPYLAGNHWLVVPHSRIREQMRRIIS